MMVFSVSEFIGCIKFRIFREQGVIQQPNLYDRLYVLIVFTGFQTVEGPAKIAEGTFHPVVLVYDLHFEMDNGTIIEGHLDVKEKGFCINRSSQFDGIQDRNRDDVIVPQMKKGADEPFQCGIAALQESLEEVIVGHVLVES